MTDAIKNARIESQTGKISYVYNPSTTTGVEESPPPSSATVFTPTSVGIGGVAYLPLLGGTMLGSLILSGDPVLDLEAATKQYVDDLIAGVDGGSVDLSGYVLKAGDTMTGLLTLSGAPTTGLHATTKTYVDTADALKLNLSGGTLTGTLTLAGDPTNALEAATKQYVDGLIPDVSGFVLRAGDTMTGDLILAGDPTVALEAATKQYVDARLALAGGTMTGDLILSGDPTVALEAATKQYVDARLALAGGTMTGDLVLAADPDQPLEAATKQYVDGLVPPLSFVVYVEDKPTDAAVLTRFKAPEAFNFPLNMSTSFATASVAATAETVFTIKKNGTSFGTATFAAAGVEGTFAVTATSFAAGDTFSLEAPATADTTLANIGFTFVGVRV